MTTDNIDPAVEQAGTVLEAGAPKDEFNVVPSPSRQRTPKFKVVSAFAAAALIIGGGIGFLKVSSAAAGGGESTDAPAKHLFAADSTEDADAATDILLPAAPGTPEQPTVHLVDELHHLELLDTPAPIGGTDGADAETATAVEVVVENASDHIADATNAPTGETTLAITDSSSKNTDPTVKDEPIVPHDTAPTSDIDADIALLNQCWDQTEQAMQECFSETLASGKLHDRTLIPVHYRHPECPIWDLDKPETMSDEEYVEVVTAAMLCWQGPIEAGDATEEDLPAVFTQKGIGCAGGQNPFRDQNLEDEWFSCVYA